MIINWRRLLRPNTPLVHSAARTRHLSFVALASIVSAVTFRPATAQTITTAAGGGGYTNAPPLSVDIGSPGALTVGPAGGIYVADWWDLGEGSEIFRIDPATGAVTRVVGNGVPGSAGAGGPAADISLNEPTGLAFDAQGDLYISDTLNERILKVSADPTFDPADPAAMPGGPITSKSTVTVFSDLAGTYGFPTTLALDPASQELYFAFTTVNYSNLVMKITLSDGTQTAVAGCTASCLALQPAGPPVAATSVALSPVDAIAVDSTGNLYLADGNDLASGTATGLLKVSATDGTISSIAPDVSGRQAGCTRAGSLSQAYFLPTAVDIDAAGNLLLLDQSRLCRIAVDPSTGRIDDNSQVVSLAGGGAPTGSTVAEQPGYGDGGLASNAYLDIGRFSAVATDTAGNIYVSSGVDRVRKISVDPATGIADSNSLISTAAGVGPYPFGGDGNRATSATLDTPEDVAVDARGDLYIASDNLVRRVDAATGKISTVAGYWGVAPSSCPDGGAWNSTSAICDSFESPTGVAVDASGNFYFSDGSNRVIRVTPTGAVSIIAGGGVGSPGCGDGGLATDACLSNPHGLAFDLKGNLYIADTGDNEIREVDTSGIIHTIAGNGQVNTSAPCNGSCPGDGGPAVDASLNRPMFLVVDPAGNVYFTDDGDSAVRRVDATSGVIATLSWDSFGGWGTGSFCGNDPLDLSGIWTCLQKPVGIALDAAGNLFVSDAEWNRIVELSTPQPAALGKMSPALLSKTRPYG